MPWIRPIFRNIRESVILLFFIVIVFNWIVYYPSFFQVGRADQTIFLIETARYDKLSELVKLTYSYPRTRQLDKGDEVLFKPLCYFFMSFEKWLFGYHFIYWQLVGFLLHILLLLQLYRILNLIGTSSISVFFTLQFSLLTISSDMVAWHHVSSYILFLIFLLEAFYQFIRYLQGGLSNEKNIIRMTASLTIACFLNDFGFMAVFAFLIMLLFLEKLVFNKKSGENANGLKKKHAILGPGWLLMLPIVWYLVLDILDYMVHVKAPGLKIGLGSMSLNKIVHALFYFFWLFVNGLLFPSFVYLYPTDRTILSDFSITDVLSKLIWTGDPLHVINLVFLIVLLIVLAYPLFVLKQGNAIPQQVKPELSPGTTKKIPSAASGASFILAFLYLLYIVLGRMVVRNQYYILESSYHYYVFSLFVTIGVYGIFINCTENFQKVDLNWRTSFSILLCLSIFLNGSQSYSMNNWRGTRERPIGAFVRDLEGFVKEHKKEPDFSFRIVFREVDKLIGVHIGNPAEKVLIKGYLTDNLFWNYVKDENVKYDLVYTQKDGLKSFTDKKRLEEYLAGMGKGIKQKILPY